VNDKQASHPIARNGHDLHYPVVGPEFGTPEQEIQHLKMTIAGLTADLEAERAKLLRATEGARYLDDRVWELQQLLHKMNRSIGTRILDALRALREVCVDAFAR
jgi:hypothetical protein